MNLTRLITGAVSITLASALLKFGNENYEMLKAEAGLLAPVACLIGGIVLGIYGLRSFVRAFSRS